MHLVFLVQKQFGEHTSPFKKFEKFKSNNFCESEVTES